MASACQGNLDGIKQKLEECRDDIKMFTNGVMECASNHANHHNGIIHQDKGELSSSWTAVPQGSTKVDREQTKARSKATAGV